MATTTDRPCPERISGLLEELVEAEEVLAEAKRRESEARNSATSAVNRVNSLRGQVKDALESYNLDREVR